MSSEQCEALRLLRRPAIIRTRCDRILEAALAGRSRHFHVRLDRLTEIASCVARVTRARYPDLRVPYHSRWRHFGVDGRDRYAQLQAEHPGCSGWGPEDRARSMIDLTVVSVLLDAGAGHGWRFLERETGKRYGRSEGLALASLHLFGSGVLSCQPTSPLRVDAEGLERLSEARFAAAFQAGPENPLAGLENRVRLLRRLGRACRLTPEVFERNGELRPGHLLDHFRRLAGSSSLDAAEVLEHLLAALAPIWPRRLELAGSNLGDVWRHPQAGGNGTSRGLVPFHKLSQWLTYSLIEPLQVGGLKLRSLEALTGLAEYRNGGLFIDYGALELKHPETLAGPQQVGSEAVIEWRALTVSLLDRLADEVRDNLGRSSEQLPLARILQGGTWEAGRRIAGERRSHAAPPIVVSSDATVF
ncbi:MAG: URC4/urg3 family protein [Proteobacteria bacterium]|nr:URC4/urg3 family protein [Pseudomonadota bacterium]